MCGGISGFTWGTWTPAIGFGDGGFGDVHGSIVCLVDEKEAEGKVYVRYSMIVRSGRRVHRVRA